MLYEHRDQAGKAVPDSCRRRSRAGRHDAGGSLRPQDQVAMRRAFSVLIRGVQDEGVKRTRVILRTARDPCLHIRIPGYPV